MLEIINTKIGGFAKSHGTQMPGNFRSALMSGSNGCAKFRRGDEHVSLEIVHSLVKPEIYRAGRILRPSELVHLNGPRALPSRYGPVTCIFGPGISPASIAFFISRSV